MLPTPNLLRTVFNSKEANKEVSGKLDRCPVTERCVTLRYVTLRYVTWRLIRDLEREDSLVVMPLPRLILP